MIRYTKTSYDFATGKSIKELVTEMVGRSLYTCYETVQVMSDIWEQQFTLVSIGEDGSIRKHALGDEKPVYELDAGEQAFKDHWNYTYNRYVTGALQKAEVEAQRTDIKGNIVNVVRGKDRSVIGKVGKVVVVLERPYGMGYRTSLRAKLGIAISDRMVDKVMPNGKVFKNYADIIWVWAHNCDLVETTVVINHAGIKATAQQIADRSVTDLRQKANACNKKAA